jgi:hypothetical protein
MSPKRRGQRRGRYHQAVVRRHGSTDANARARGLRRRPGLRRGWNPDRGWRASKAPDGLDGRGHSGWKDDLLTLAAPDLARSG